MNKDIYARAKAELERRRSSAISLADSRSALLAEMSEEIREIDKELSGTGLMLFKIACEGGDIAPLKERNQALVKKRREIIVSLGYPADYTDLHYTCKECSDSGFVGDGTRMCSCLKELIIKERIAASGIGKLIEKQSFENFDLSVYAFDEAVHTQMCANLAAAKNYVKHFDKDRGNLLLIGKTGTGKTHISTAIARELIHKGYDVIYDSAQNIVSDFEADRFRSGYGTYEPKSEKHLECELLIIDDLGTEFASQFTLSTIYNLLNTRQNKRLATIISTNLSPDELAKRYEDRVYSRIIGSGCKVLAFVGKDKRVN